jgi:hypothetical protein
MTRTISTRIAFSDFSFEHSLAKVVANRNSQEIKLAGLTVGSFEEGSEYEIQLWIAQLLDKAGIVHFREEERLDATKLYKIQWTERVQSAGQISKLPDNFYPKLRRLRTQLKAETAKAPERMREYEKVTQLMQDIMNSRLKKIVSLASASAQTEQMVRNNFTHEERLLYEELHKTIHEWRTRILEYEGREK